MKSFLRILTCLAAISALSVYASAQVRWMPYGPDGGDARSFAPDPHDHLHIYLGTVNGSIYDTHNGGNTWQRLANVAKRDDVVLDNIEVDPANPQHVLVGGWVLDHEDGGLYVSNDGGHTWTANPQMKGHSIRAMAHAPSDPKTFVIGALDGVYRSRDGGNTWTLISPQGSRELHEIESIAIDPKDPEIIYAGTWHLPWKTTDGGTTWTNMKQGIIDDSDVFSIIVDPTNQKKIFLSACSGIYRSDNQGESFLKVQGIPSTARRTRVLMEDPREPATVFAGTTEGLWKTSDAGHSFLRNGDPGWIINDVNIDPQNSQRVLLATDRTGVLLSTDGGLTFAPANHGFSSRQISSIAQDRSNSNRVFVGIINDKTAGGVFASLNGGVTWTQRSTGLNGADVFSLAQTPDGSMLAGTRHGIYRLADDLWMPSSLMAVPPPPPAPARRPAAGRTSARSTPARRVAPARTPPPPPAQQISGSVYALASNESAVFAGTEDGLLSSYDNGYTWNEVRSAHGQPWRIVTTQGLRVGLADLHDIALSVDKGVNFHTVHGPEELTYITALAIDDGGRMWVGGREGIWVSDNDGVSWHTQTGLFVPNVSGIYYDRAGSRVLVTAREPSTTVFAVHTPDMKVTYRDSGWTLRTVRAVSDHLLGITPFEGVVLEPRWVDTPVKPWTQVGAGD